MNIRDRIRLLTDPAYTPPAPVDGDFRTAVVESFGSYGHWTVRYGPGVTEVEHLRPWQFRFAATNPQIAPANLREAWNAAPDTRRLDGRAVWPGQRVQLHYIVARGSGLWYAYPISDQGETPPPTA